MLELVLEILWIQIVCKQHQKGDGVTFVTMTDSVANQILRKLSKLYLGIACKSVGTISLGKETDPLFKQMLST